MNIGDVFLRVRPDLGGFETEVQRQTSRAAGRAGRSAGGAFGNNMLGELTRLAVGAVGVRKAFDSTIGAAIEWESQFAGVEKTVDGTTEELAGLEHGLRTMAKTMPVARGELAAIAEQAGALGIAVDDIEAFTEVVAQIGATTNVSSEQAATALGQLSNVLDLTERDYERFGAALVDLGNKGASTEQQILDIASRAGAGASLIDIAADATLGWSSAVANLGIEAEAGGSSLQTFFLKAAEFVGEGGEKVRAMADTARMSVAEFTDLFNNDASAALSAFISGLGELDQTAQLAVLGLLDFNDIRIRRTLLGLAGNSNNLNESLEIGAEAWAENTALQEEYGKRARTTASRIEMLGNRISDLGVRVGESQGGPLDWLLTATEMSIDGWERMLLDAELRFGAHGDRLSALGDRMGIGLSSSFFGGDIESRVLENMLEWGTSVEETITLMEQGLTPALKEAEDRYLEYVEATSIPLPLEENAERGVSAFGSAMDQMDDETREALEDAREAANAGAAAILQGMVNLFENDDSVQEAFQALLDRMDDPYTEAERRADTFSQNTIDLIRGALRSGDPAIAADTLTLVNNMLAQFDLIEPGALAEGEGVPPAIRDGMDSAMSELIDWVEQTLVPEGLEALSLEDAKERGIEGIWFYSQGMRDNEMTATAEARYVAGRAKEALLDADFYGGGTSVVRDEYAPGIDDGESAAEAAALRVSNAARLATFLADWYGAGKSVGIAWANGLVSASDWARLMSWELAAAADPALHGLSPPKEGPLRHIDEWGFNIGKAWADGLVTAVEGGIDFAAGLGMSSAPMVGFGSLGDEPGVGGDTFNIPVTVQGLVYGRDSDEIGAAVKRYAETGRLVRDHRLVNR